MALSQAKIESLLAPASKQSASGYYVTMDGIVHQGKVPANMVGSFVGKAGSIRRTSKGATVRNLDGSRKYLASGGIHEEVAYYMIRR